MDEKSLQYLTDKIRAEYGDEWGEKVERGYAVRRFTTLRANTLKSDIESVKEGLLFAGIEYVSVPWYRDALILTEADERAIRSLPMFERGEVYLQSLSSMMPPFALAPRAGETILDMAAAPGGKTTQMAAMSENQASITACEFHSGRAEKLKFNLQKQGATRVNVMVTDARALSEFFAFDKILLDAPCSGSGTVSLGESSKAEYNDKLLKKITTTQVALLKKGLSLLKKGKSLVYSTCSLFKEENEEVIKAALKGTNCVIEPLSPTMFIGAQFLPTTLDGTLCICPDEYYEGFFLAKLRKP
jgi:NOL1/NOP2/sun family putative RNA methylase